MARFNYAGLAAKASALIEKFSGATGVTLYHSAVTPDDDEPWKVVDDSSSQTLNAVRVEINAREIDGETIRAGDTRYLLAGADLATPPKAGDLLDDDGQKLRVVLVSTTQPGDDALLHTVTCRK